MKFIKALAMASVSIAIILGSSVNANACDKPPQVVFERFHHVNRVDCTTDTAYVTIGEVIINYKLNADHSAFVEQPPIYATIHMTERAFCEPCPVNRHIVHNHHKHHLCKVDPHHRPHI